jgi:hypothetical protein
MELVRALVSRTQGIAPVIGCSKVSAKVRAKGEKWKFAEGEINK